jgi:hypothetical protein
MDDERLFPCPKPPTTTFGFDLPAESPISTAVQEMIDKAIEEELRREEQVAIIAVQAGVGYARIDARDGYATDYVLSSYIPAMHRYDFPSWDAFEQWRDREMGS